MYAFEEFELSEEEFSLRRRGTRLPLEPRALRLLLMMAANAGKLLDKKALLDAVWKDTFVEETTLTRAIAVIRKRLGDDPRAPTYIETVPTRGYRFIAQVEVRANVQAALATAFREPLADTQSAERSEKVGVAPPDSSPVEADGGEQAFASPEWWHKRRNAWILLAALVLLPAIVGTVLFLRHGSARLGTAGVVVLADFRNSTGEPVFDDALRQGLLVQLEQSPLLRLASDDQVLKTRKLMSLHPVGALTPEEGRELCQRIGGAVVLDGSISRLGTAYVLGLRARACGSGEQLDVEQAQVAQKEQMLDALSRMATRFRKRVGEATATLQALDTPLAEATTPSLEALQAFSLGMRTFNLQGSSAAVPLFQHAVEIDPTFAWAHAWLGRMYADVGQEELAAESTRRAYALRNRTSERERFAVDVSYDLLVTGNLEKARSACDAWLRLYPRDVYPRAFLAAYIFPAYGQYEPAVEQARQSIAIDPDFVVGYRNAVINLIALNRLSEAKAVLQQAVGRGVFLPSFVTDAYRIAFLQGDERAMKQALARAPTNPWLRYYESATLLSAGRVRESRAVQEEALRLTRLSGRKGLEAELLASASVAHVLYGYPAEGAAQAREALLLLPGRNVAPQAALAFALSGHLDEAVLVVGDLRKRFPEDTVLQRRWIPAIESAVQLARPDPGQALQLLDAAGTAGAGTPLYPVCLRGQALLAAGRAAEAAVEFGKVLGQPGVVLNDPLRGFAQVQLARAYAAAGRHGDARNTYGGILRQWDGADADLPLLRQITAEAAKL